MKLFPQKTKTTK